MFGLDVLITVANVIYLCSYAVRDILWLRVLTVIGATLLLPYYYYQEAPLWAAISWNSVFIAINIFWIVRLFLDRRPVQLSAEEKRLYEIALRNMSKREAFGLFRMAQRSTVPEGTALLVQNEAVRSLTLIIDGKVSVDINGTIVDTLGEGRFLGAAAFLSKDPHKTAPVSVRATEPTKMFVWKFSELQAKLNGNPDLEIDIEASLGLEITRFLQAARVELLST
ncbi:cyclic nucleotide-binding domain-containing protein [Labrenzia sp. DG1229]|uniref:cyclic nucleotide-binding domain-containing protein n=1 Tax=Labrenzia sp. DG1229 TaxID=681847 RepID=UPI000691B8FC|nr:cyclic nucleotide-binding domain-containing protein [Labrenzia sp. DG1229]